MKFLNKRPGRLFRHLRYLIPFDVRKHGVILFKILKGLKMKRERLFHNSFSALKVFSPRIQYFSLLNSFKFSKDSSCFIRYILGVPGRLDHAAIACYKVGTYVQEKAESPNPRQRTTRVYGDILSGGIIR